MKTQGGVALSAAERWGYALGAGANGIHNKVVGAFVLIFYNQVLGLSAAAVGAVITASLVLEAVCTPVLGLASDHLRSRIGRRHPFMLAGMVLYPIAFAMLWLPPAHLGQAGLTAWLAVTLIAARLLDACYELPASALLPELVADYDGRTRLAAKRFCIGVVMATVAALLAYNVFLRNGVGERPGWTPFGLTCAGLSATAIAASVFSTLRIAPSLRAPPPARLSLGELARLMRQTLATRSYAATALFGGLASMATGLYFAMNVYFMLYYWGLSQKQAGFVQVATLAAAAGALVIAPRVGARLGKRNAAILFAIASTLACNLPVLARNLFDLMPENGSPELVAILWLQAMAFPLSTAGYSMMLSSMVADMVEEAELKTGRRSEGLLNSAETLFKKLVSGGGGLAAGWILVTAGFPANAGRSGVGPQTLDRMGDLYCGISLAFTAAAIVAVSFYRLDRKAHQSHLDWLQAEAAVED